jgi:collagenase-like PrtC family protease
MKAADIFPRDKHLLSMKDNDQSRNLEALIDAGIRSFKIEGRYKDMGYVKNITAHYRLLLDEILERRAGFVRAARTTSAPSIRRNTWACGWAPSARWVRISWR